MAELTLGSLFDGSGGFPLGGLLCGIRPVWASEVEPFAIRVTTKRLPEMEHLGDISRIRGGEVEPVDIITFGSPCTNLSIAGKREGLAGQQSGLFYQAVRIIKEMREATNGRYPRYCVWENVVGAYSSNKGFDFKAVLEEIIGIVRTGTEVPMPADGRWPYADCYMGDGWSVAYRTLDAQYWGVPQRRKRIYLVADFDGGSAGKVLFESEGVSGYSAEGFRAWQRAARGAEAGIGAAGIGFDCYNGTLTHEVSQTVTASAGTSGDRQPMVFEENIILNDQGGQRMDVSVGVTGTLRAQMDGHPPLVYENHSQDTRYTGPLDVAQTVSATYGSGGNNQPFVVEDAECYDVRFTSEGTKVVRGHTYPTDTARTIDTGGNAPDSNQGGIAVVETPKTLKIRSGCEGGGKGALIQDDKSATLGCNNDQAVFVPAAFGICSKQSHSMLSDNPHAGFYEASTSRTLDRGGGNPTCNQGGIAVVEGNGTRPSHLGDGYKESEIMYTLNATEQHAVAYAMTTGAYTQVCEEQAPTLMARDWKDPAVVNEPTFGIGRDTMNQGRNALFSPAVSEEVQPTLVAKGPGAVMKAEPEYSVRRLTPTECARLQGFPDWWCSGLGTKVPSQEELDWWAEVFETHRKIVGTSSKPKTRKQIFKWLQNPHSDAAEYKLWGNGVALPCVYFVLAGIAWYAQNPPL